LHARARLVKIGTAEARAHPGVVGVFAAPDLPEVATPIPPPYGKSLHARPFVLPALAKEAVRYVGEPVAVVVADEPYRLADALDAITVEYDTLPPVLTGDDALQGGVRVHEEWPDNVAVVARGAVNDVERGLATADLVVQERFRHPRCTGMPIEPRGVLAYPDADAGTLVVWSSTQSPYRIRDVLAMILDLPAERVRVRVPDVGGAFGVKGEVYPEEILVAAVALRLGRAVKWLETRREHFVATGHDREQTHDARIGFTRDGVIVALDDAFQADVGVYPTEDDGLTLNTVNHLPGPYRVPHYRGVGVSFVTNKTVNVAYRGAGRPEAALVTERLLDIGARRLGLDPAEIRRRNLVGPDEMPYRPGLTYKDGVPIAYDPADFPAAFEQALALFGYREYRARQAAQADAPRRLGIGLACYVQGSGLGPYEGATVRVDPKGTVYVFVGVAAQGQGHATTLAQICAAELAVSFDDVVVVSGDTQVLPFGMGTGGSRVAANAGPAVARAARAVREKATRVAAELLECAPQDIRIENGRVLVAGAPSRSLTLARVAQAAIRAKSLKSGGEPGLQRCTFFYPDTVTWAFGTQAAAVEVDLDTCEVRVLAYLAVHDSGRPINPAIVEGQLQGGVAQGIGAALMEELVYDRQGQLVTGSLMDYAVPRADQLPWIVTAHLDHPSVVNDLGIKGVGESGAIAPAAVIANAVEDALADFGVTIREVPVTPARLFELLRSARRPS
ncbi:MAG: xanthine dehydrogenase family protein molybdopterin-binding subunit, partial [Candidatus Rokuibacteriota bacterium]